MINDLAVNIRKFLPKGLANLANTTFRLLPLKLAYLLLKTTRIRPIGIHFGPNLRITHIFVYLYLFGEPLDKLVQFILVLYIFVDDELRKHASQVQQAIAERICAEEEIALDSGLD